MMRVIVVALLTLSASGGPALAQEPDEKALKDVSRKFTAAWNSGNAAGLAALYAQDAVLTTPGGITARGRQGIQDHAAAELREKKGSRMTFSAEEFRPIGAEAAVWRCEWKLTGLKDGATAKGTGLAVLVKSGAEWLIVEDVAALTPAAPAGAKKPGNSHGAGEHGHDHGPGGHSHDH